MAKTHIKTILVKPPRIRRLHRHANLTQPADPKEQPAVPPVHTPPVHMPPAQEQYLKANKNDCF